MNDNAIYKLEKWAAEIRFQNTARKIRQEAIDYIHTYGDAEFDILSDKTTERVYTHSVPIFIHTITVMLAYLLGIMIGHTML